MDKSALWTLAGVVLGWLLSQLTDWHKSSKQISKNEKALFSELDDIKGKLIDIILSYERSFQIYALGGLQFIFPLPINNFVFKKCYSDTLLHLPASQRKSYELIHSYVDAINQGIERIASVYDDVDFDDLSDEILDQWKNALHAEYMNAQMAYWHVDYHLNNQHFPYLENWTSVHDSMLQERERAHKRVEEVIAHAKENLSRENFSP